VAATLNGALVGGSYGASQLANALPVAMGFVPAAARSAVVTRLVDLISNAATPGLITAGILGMQLIFQALSQNGHADLVYQYLQRTDQPSYLQMLNDGPGTIWEAWNDPSTTNDQPALGGAPGQWCYQQLAGIEPSLLAGQGGYKAITFAPHVDGTVASASGTIATPRGTVTSAWTLTGTSRLTLRVTVPANASGTVVVPRLNAAATTISESGTAVFANGASTGTTPGLFFVAADASTVTFRVGSGTYAFDVGTSAP
jgi:alpha-L-rhamnosidase